MKHLEDKLQIQCMDHMREYHKDIICYHVPNGGKRNIREASRLKRMGVTPGIPDITIDAPRGGYHGMKVELKAGKNKPSKAQAEMLTRLSKEGYYTCICWSLEEFITEVEFYLKGNK